MANNLVLETKLVGQHLIEASAGTGKTYTIALLYLRALLGIGTYQQQCLDVSQILVVTFTNAATEELAERIRRRIDDALRLLLSAQVSAEKQSIKQKVDEQNGDTQKVDEQLAAVLAKSTLNTETAILKLRIALARIDSAQISTIHSFASRLLSQTAFSGGLPIGITMNIDNDTYDQPIKNYWRAISQDNNDTCEDGAADFINTKSQLTKLLSKAQVTVKSSSLHPQVFADFDRQLAESKYQQLIGQKAFKASRLNKTNFAKYLDQIEGFINKQSSLNLLSVSKLSSGFINSLISEKQDQINSEFYLNEKEYNIFTQCQEIIERFGNKGKILHSDIATTDALKLTEARDAVLRQLEKTELQSMNLSADRILTLAAEAVGNPAMATLVRKNYPLAMIDEFQDTDAIQYKIFSAVYKDQNKIGFLMIGDPKQSIYSFRGGDVFAYLKARQDAHQYTMDNNFRSTATMVLAVNRLFNFGKSSTKQESLSNKPAFMIDGLSFNEVLSSSGKIPIQLLSNNNNNDDNNENFKQPLEAFTACYNPTNRDIEQKITRTRQQAADSAAHYVQKLLFLSSNDKLFFEENKGKQAEQIKAADIAILVRGHNEGRLVKQSLTNLGIPSVNKSRDPIFAEAAALDVWYLIRAIHQPQSETNLRAALLSTSLAYSFVTVQKLLENPNDKMDLQQCFLEASKRLNLSGPLPAVLHLLNDLQRSAAMMTALGERGLTNFLQVVEILQEQFQEIGGGFQLLRWFSDALQDPDRSEEKLVRLESDARRVQISTIHGAKGLEYPIVLLPFSWDAKDSSQVTPPYFYHDEASTLLAGLSDFDKQQEQREITEENLRLFYVAATRASHHCWIYFTDHGDKASSKNDCRPSSKFNRSPLGYYFPTNVDTESVENAYLNFCSAMTGIENKNPQQRVYGEAIKSVIIPKTWSTQDKLPTPTKTAEIFGVDIDTRCSKTSFTALMRGQSSPLKDIQETFVESSAPEEIVHENNRFSLARGAHIGTAIHNALESFPFASFNYSDQQLLAQRFKIELHAYGVLKPDEDYDQTNNELQKYTQWLAEVLDTPFLNSNNYTNTDRDNSFALRNLNNWFPELRFDFQLGSNFTTDRLNTILTRHNKLLPKLKYNETNGLLNGAIDLVFCVDGKYYLADYKSSYLGNRFADYDTDALIQKNEESGYALQYLIYSVALQRHLKQRLGTRYSYIEHFGGVYYLYLRGMHPDHPGKGIFYELPNQKLIDDLDQELFS